MRDYATFKPGYWTGDFGDEAQRRRAICAAEEYGWDDEEVTCSCGRLTAGEDCKECGVPLCPMCFEYDAGFCSVHPSERYQRAIGSGSEATT